MNEKEIGELRRSLSLENNAVNRAVGCYVNAVGNVIAKFDRSFGIIEEEEVEKYLSIFKKVLTGTPERNLLPITFTPSQVSNGEEHSLLSRLRTSDLKDEEALEAFFSKVTQSYKSDENYVILLAVNHYDVPFHAKDGGKGESSEVFPFLVCAICPVKATKSVLTYDSAEKIFRQNNGENAVSAPEVGFLFPSFDGRSSNIYGSLLYSRSLDDRHEKLTAGLFGSELEMAPNDIEATFHSILTESLGNECSFEIARGVHREICDKIEEHKASRNPEPLTIGKNELCSVLEDVGVKEEEREKFARNYTETFGSSTDLCPKNIVSHKKFELKTPDVLIKVAPDKSDLVKTKIIDGVKYILIRADEGVELNGLNVSVESEAE